MSDLLDQRDDYRRMCDAKHPRKNQPLRAACQEGRSKCQHQGVISKTILDHMGFFAIRYTPKYKVKYMGIFVEKLFRYI